MVEGVQDGFSCTSVALAEMAERLGSAGTVEGRPAGDFSHRE